MAIGSSVTGFWQATLIEPPVLTAAAEPLGAAALLPAEAPAGVPPAAALWRAPGAVVVLHAAMTAVIDGIVRPTRSPRRTNSRREIVPRANDSTAAGWRGVGDWRPLSGRV